MDECSNSSSEDNSTAHSECCLPPGEYTLKCLDSYGNGWHGGYITINGINYCGNFISGDIETHEVLISEYQETGGKILKL